MGGGRGAEGSGGRRVEGRDQRRCVTCWMDGCGARQVVWMRSSTAGGFGAWLVDGPFDGFLVNGLERRESNGAWC